jgi:hypothetical protein
MLTPEACARAVSGPPAMAVAQARPATTAGHSLNKDEHFDEFSFMFFSLQN